MANYDNSQYSYADVLNNKGYYMKDDLLRYSAGVQTMQQKFNSAGYSCGTADGKFGAGTDKVVREFQAGQFITVDGKAGKGTLTLLDNGYDNSRYTYDYVLSSTSAYYARDTKLRFSAGVRTMQTKLRAAGYTCDTDGKFGAGTASAVKSFQSARGLTVDGRAGKNTLLALNSSSGGGNGNSGVRGEYITAGVGGWLKLYKKPTSSKVGRTVTIPTVVNDVDSAGHTCQFKNRNYWYAYEPAYPNGGINPYAADQIKSTTKKSPVVNVGTNGELTDENGNYWMAVGPKIPYPSQSSSARILPKNMYGLGKLDVVVQDADGIPYYIPGVIGDIKEHTWSNGVIQTFRQYPDGTRANAYGAFNGTVCAEFIGNLGGKLVGLGAYSVVKIIFYAD